MKKAVVVLVLIILIISSFNVIAIDNNSTACSGVWGSISCFLWGNPENRAGMAWWDRSSGLPLSENKEEF